MPELRTEFIEKAVRGDIRAFESIVTDCQPFAYSVAYRLLGNAEEAEDVVQEAFVRLWKHLPRYRFEVKITTWLYRIVVNLCLDFLKSAYYRQQKSAVETDQMVFQPASCTTDDPFHCQELHAFIQEAASSLTPKQKAVFILRDLEDLSVAEVSAILDMPQGAIKSNLYYARQYMCEKLKQYYGVSENPMKL